MEERIEINPAKLSGVPVIRGTRIPVFVILASLADGYSVERLVAEFDGLTSEDVFAALDYAAKLADRPTVAVSYSSGSCDSSPHVRPVAQIGGAT